VRFCSRLHSAAWEGGYSFVRKTVSESKGRRPADRLHRLQFFLTTVEEKLSGRCDKLDQRCESRLRFLLISSRVSGRGF
jgi:hypothetical protein